MTHLGRNSVTDEVLILVLIRRFGRINWTDKLTRKTRHSPNSYQTNFPSDDEFSVFSVSNMNSANIRNS